MPRKNKKEELVEELVIKRLRNEDASDVEKKLQKIKGAGFFGDLWDSAKAIGSRVVSTVKAVANVVSGKAPRQNFPPYVRKILAEDGNLPIVEMRVRRDPIQNMINTALNVVSSGKFNELKQRMGYDKFFHLGLEVTVRISESDNVNKRYIIEKNEVIQINEPKPYTEETESMLVPMGGKGATMNSLLKGSQMIQGDKFFTYDPFFSNCQDFVMSILTGSGFGNKAIFDFVKQPIGEVIAELPSFTQRLARGITDIGGVVDVLLSGEGGNKPNKRFAKKLKKWKIDPSEYLAEARKKAKALGLPENMLGFSTDPNKKLQMPDPSGKIIRFGATNYGDYIAYRLSGDKTADRHREEYRARATKTAKRTKNPYSPASLALEILW